MLVFGEVIDKSGAVYPADIRSVLKTMPRNSTKRKATPSMPPTKSKASFLPGSMPSGVTLRRQVRVRQHRLLSFPSRPSLAHLHRHHGRGQGAMGFEEKHHPEVAPSQFEINYSYGEAVVAADQIELDKLICRQVATRMGFSFPFRPSR